MNLTEADLHDSSCSPGRSDAFGVLSKGWKRGLCSVLTDTRVFGIQSRHGHVRQRVFCSVIGCRGDPRARTRRHDGKGMQKGFPSWRTLTTPRRDARGVSSSLAHLSTAFSPSPPENRWLNPYHAQDHTSAHMPLSPL